MLEYMVLLNVLDVVLLDYLNSTEKKWHHIDIAQQLIFLVKYPLIKPNKLGCSVGCWSIAVKIVSRGKK
jgi:hypothetical protein